MYSKYNINNNNPNEIDIDLNKQKTNMCCEAMMVGWTKSVHALMSDALRNRERVQHLQKQRFLLLMSIPFLCDRASYIGIGGEGLHVRGRRKQVRVDGERKEERGERI
jgi:hypothetical protein